MEDGPFVRKYTYDRAGGRLTTVQDGGNLLLKRLTYGRSSTASNRANGRLVQAVNYQYPNLGQGTREQRFVEDFRYSGVGGARSYRKVSWVRECEPGETTPDCLDDGFCDEESFEHNESFDPTGKLAGLTYPTCVSADGGCGPLHARTVTYNYDPGSGFLTSIPGWVSDVRYHRNLTVQQVDHTNGISEVVDEDPHHMSRPAAMRVMSGADVLWQSGTFRYDGAGNLLEMATPDWKDFFRYDGVSRLKESHQWIRRPPNQGNVIFTDGFETGDVSHWNDTDETFPVNRYTVQTFTHDVPGNLLSVTTDGDQVQHQVSSQTNRLTGNAQYDGAGNLTQLTDDTGTTTFTYDSLKRLVRRDRAGHTTHFFYTADDERVLTFGSNGFEWALRDLGGRLLREFVPEADRIKPIRDHIYRGSGLVATVAADGNGNLTQIRHQSLDHLASPRYITDGSGEYVSEHKYYPFGGEATQNDQNDLPLKFTGHERDFYADGSEDDLDYMHARYCDPRLGRFLSMDPVSGIPQDPQSWNRFTYALNSPMKFVDPSGRVVKFADGILDEDRRNLLSQLSDKTGLVLSVQDKELVIVGKITDSDGNLIGSSTAREDLKAAIEAETDVWVRGGRNTSTNMGRRTGPILSLDFADIDAIIPGENGPDTFDASMIFLHELAHWSGLKDPARNILERVPSTMGNTVRHINQIRTELGYPTRLQYLAMTTTEGDVTRHHVPFSAGDIYIPTSEVN